MYRGGGGHCALGRNVQGDILPCNNGIMRWGWLLEAWDYHTSGEGECVCVRQRVLTSIAHLQEQHILCMWHSMYSGSSVVRALGSQAWDSAWFWFPVTFGFSFIDRIQICVYFQLCKKKRPWLCMEPSPWFRRSGPQNLLLEGVCTVDINKICALVIILSYTCTTTLQ